MGIAAPETPEEYKRAEDLDAAWDAAIDHAVKIAEKWLKTGHITSHVFEMTPPELRCVKDVVKAIIAEIKAP